MDEWKYVFLLTAGFYIVSGIFFIAFGSGKVQKWNEIKQQPAAVSAEPEVLSVKL